jgi:hypothetical protein
VKAWHWLKDDMHSGSGRERAWVEGEERTHFSKTLLICERGYHSSPTPWDGLSYAQGNVLCLVEISEPEAQQDDKYVSRTRKLIKAINVEHELRAFACDVAEEALTKEREAGREPDARSWNAIAVARRYNAGEATKEELAAARDAARAAAWAAARDAAWAAAWDATRDAAWAAARDAATAAASAAARDAARDAAWAAARDAFKARFNARFEALFAEEAVPS